MSESATTATTTFPGENEAPPAERAASWLELPGVSGWELGIACAPLASAATAF